MSYNGEDLNYYEPEKDVTETRLAVVRSVHLYSLLSIQPTLGFCWCYELLISNRLLL